MKKFITAVVCTLAMCCSSLFAEDNNSDYKAGDNVFIFEGTVGLLGFSVNEVVTFDHLFNETFGIGGGIALSEGVIGSIEGFLDLKVQKFNFGIGGGVNYAYGTPSILLRAVYHGNSWNWGKLKAGMTVGADWHIAKNNLDEEDVTLGDLLAPFPRFIIGINAQL